MSKIDELMEESKIYQRAQLNIMPAFVHTHTRTHTRTQTHTMKRRFTGRVSFPAAYTAYNILIY